MIRGSLGVADGPAFAARRVFRGRRIACDAAPKRASYNKRPSFPRRAARASTEWHAIAAKKNSHKKHLRFRHFMLSASGGQRGPTRRSIRLLEPLEQLEQRPEGIDDRPQGLGQPDGRVGPEPAFAHHK